jgi:hypothetical protein
LALGQKWDVDIHGNNHVNHNIYIYIYVYIGVRILWAIEEVKDEDRGNSLCSELVIMVRLTDTKTLKWAVCLKLGACLDSG